MKEKSIDCLPLCEEAFLAGHLRTAQSYAITIALANPDAPEPFSHLAAYNIHVRATNERTVSGEINWYAVMGIDPMASMDQIYSRYNDLKELLGGHVKEFAALHGARNLVVQAMSVLGNPPTKIAYDARRSPLLASLSGFLSV